MHSLHRQADEAGNMNKIRLTVQCFSSNGCFNGKLFNVKLCIFCLYSGFIFLPGQNIHINKVPTESRLLISVLLYYYLTQSA